MSNDERFDEDLLSRALHEEADRVQTDPGALQAIRQRTAGSRASGSSRRPWLYAGVGAAAATAAVIAAVAVVSDNASERAAGPSTGTQTSDDDGQDQQLPPVGATIDVTLPVLGTPREGFRLHSETRAVPVPDGEDGRISALRGFLRQGAVDSDYTTGWPEDLDVGGIGDTPDGSVHVDLTGPAAAVEPAAGLSGQGRGLAVQAFFRAAGGHPGDVATLSYNGTDLSSIFGVPLPVTIAADSDTRADVDIDGVLDGQRVTSPVQVDVSGNTFEATLNWKLADSSGRTVDRGFVNVGSYDEWRSATIDLGTLDPGDYTLTAYEQDMETGDIANSDDKTFTVE